MKRQAIRNGLLISLLPDLSVQRGDLVVEDGIIVAVGDGIAKGIDDAVDARGAVVLPGLVNAHTHLYSALAVGMAGPAVAPAHHERRRRLARLRSSLLTTMSNRVV